MKLHRHSIVTLAFATFAFLLAACQSATAPAQNAAAPTVPPAEAAASKPVKGVVDYSCTSDDQCAIKNVGNCCGEYPACVNVDSPTFPQQVKAACEREGRMAVCGFPEIAGCRCIDQRCAPVHGAGPVRSD